jgi:phage/plasmid primase-like uncharacterized protein
MHRKLPVLRIWAVDDGMLSFYCAHCEASGYARSDEDARGNDRDNRHRQAQRAANEREATQLRVDRARALWASAGPIRGTWAEAYLSGRGLTPGDTTALRFHPHCPFPDGKTSPALIVAFTRFMDLVDRDPFHELPVIAVHRIRGAGHANKAMLGPVKQAAMMLDPPHQIISELSVCEGVETALAVRRWRGGPIWALGSAGAMERFPLFKRVQRLIVWADNDATGVGQAAAQALGRRYSNGGRDVIVRWPVRRGDYAG